MIQSTELRFAPAVAAMAAFVEPHRPWLESVLGCPLGDAVTFEIELPFGQLAVEALLDRVHLDHGCLDGAAALRSAVAQWAIPPGVSPRIALEPSRNRQVALLERQLAWDPHWKETPVAIWFRGLTHAMAAIDIPFVSFAHGLAADWQHWLLVNRAEVAPALNLLRGLVFQPRKFVRVVGGRDIPLAATGYDWNQVVLDPTLVHLVRHDFEGFLQREAWFKRYGLPFRRGYLFYGPPGNGKTSVIRVMASHPAVSAHSLDFSDENMLNEAPSTVFEAAGRTAPALVIFEDLDRLFRRTPGEENPDNRTHITFQHLLNCLDGLGSQDGVIVVATANDPMALDSAILRRPGRFDRAVPFRPPGVDLRREYLHRLSRGALDAETLTLVGTQTDGFSFAQVREAYIVGGQLAFQRGNDRVDGEDLLEGIRLVRGELHTVGQRADGRSVGFGTATAHTI
jgi:ATPase family associated with various cellular activities (AAA)